MTTPKSAVNVIFGAMTIGKPGIEMTRVHTLEDTKAILDVFQSHGHKEIDTSRAYGLGSSEEYLGDLDWPSRGIVMDTKLYPTARTTAAWAKNRYDHSPEGVRTGLMDSLTALKAKRIGTFYLHAPDRETPLRDTLQEVNKLHQEGYFDRFGLSNFMTWEVARVCEICRANGWIQPTVYQGLYNAYSRRIEDELFPCLRFYGISLYCFNPLCGGFLTGRYHRNQEEFEEGSRFDPKRAQGQLHHGRYWNDAFFDALDILRPVIKKHGLTEADAGLRWLAHHSHLKKEFGDGILVGASSTHHLEVNLNALDQGPLPDDVVEALDAGWVKIRGVPQKFWH